jgi:hypothetical protein
MKSSYIRYPWRNLLYARNKKTGTVKSQRQTLARKSVIFLDSSTHLAGLYRDFEVPK